MKKEYANELLALSHDGYEKIAENFSRTRGKFWEELLFVRDLIPKNAKVLDVGCGNGRFLGALIEPKVKRPTSDFKFDYTGIDFSQGLVNVARERYSARAHTTFLVGDALALPFPDESFDATVSFAVIHHIPSKEYRVQFLRELARVTKPGGLIIITAWNVFHGHPLAIIRTAIKKLCGLSPLDIGDALLNFGEEQNVRYVHTFTMSELRSLARTAGIAIEDTRIVRRPSGEENFFLRLRT